MSDVLNPLDAGLMEVGAPPSGLQFPPRGWSVIKPWGSGYALQDRTGLRVIVDCSQKEDAQWWVHVSVSRVKTTPSHVDMRGVKQAFLGDRYAYTVFPPQEEYVNIHEHCLHLWALVDAADGQVLPEFSGIVAGVKSI